MPCVAVIDGVEYGARHECHVIRLYSNSPYKGEFVGYYKVEAKHEDADGRYADDWWTQWVHCSAVRARDGAESLDSQIEKASQPDQELVRT